MTSTCGIQNVNHYFNNFKHLGHFPSRFSEPPQGCVWPCWRESRSSPPCTRHQGPGWPGQYRGGPTAWFCSRGRGGPHTPPGCPSRRPLAGSGSLKIFPVFSFFFWKLLSPSPLSMSGKNCYNNILIVSTMSIVGFYIYQFEVLYMRPGKYWNEMMINRISDIKQL